MGNTTAEGWEDGWEDASGLLGNNAESFMADVDDASPTSLHTPQNSNSPKSPTNTNMRKVQKKETKKAKKEERRASAAEEVSAAFPCEYCGAFSGPTYDSLIEHMGSCTAL